MNFFKELLSVAFLYLVGFGIFKLGMIKGVNETRSALNFKVQNCQRIIAGHLYEH